MKRFGFGAWTLQLYWPRVWLGRGCWGIKADTAFMLRSGAGWRAAGFEILGLGFGVSYDFDALKKDAR